MLIKPKHKRKKLKRPTYRVGCPFCFEWLPAPKKVMEVFSGEGAQGGKCERCEAFFVFDEVGRLGGQAVADLQAMACDGDLDRALTLTPGVDCEIRNKPLHDGGHQSDLTKAQVWALKMGPPAPKRKPKRRKFGG